MAPTLAQWAIPAALSLYVLGYFLVMAGAYGLTSLVLRGLPKGLVHDMLQLDLLLKMRRLRLYALGWPVTLTLVVLYWALIKLGLKARPETK